MPARRRLDAELVRRGLAGTVDEARELVAASRVRVGGQPSSNPATQVRADAPVAVAAERTAPRYVSRGGHKLAGALEVFAAGGLQVTGRCCLDAGASTGGFTDVLLRRGARMVVAADVAYGELAWAVRTDPRVRVLERTNIRDLTPERLRSLGADPVELVVADLSFISLTVVLPALARAVREDADLVLMVKPQFESGRAAVGAGGVVRDPGTHATAVRRVADAGASLGLGVAGVTASPLPGPAGNVEYFLWLRAGRAALSGQDLRDAIENGPRSGPDEGGRGDPDTRRGVGGR